MAIYNRHFSFFVFYVKGSLGKYCSLVRGLSHSNALKWREFQMKISIDTLIVVALVISCQLTDVTIGPFKVWEFITLFGFVFLIRRVPRQFLFVLCVFTFYLLLSITVTYASDVVFDFYSFLKSKYVISFVRYIELLLCMIVMVVPVCLKVRNGLRFDLFLREFLKYNRYCVVLILFLYAVDYLLSLNVVSYGGDHRLKGFYVEGGPFGLYVASLFLCDLFFSRMRYFSAIYIIALLLSASKAGYALLLIGVTVVLFFKVKQLKGFANIKNKIRFSIFVVSSLLFVLLVVYTLASNYVSDIINIDKEVALRGDDSSLVMGRISGFYIGLNIVADNPLFGIGLGNYSLVRNHDEYRGFFPVVYSWDLTGLGGMLTLVIECGIIGFVIFILTFFKVMPIHDTTTLKFAMLFWLPFALGAQLYMVYPWLYLGMYLSYSNLSGKILK